MIYDHATCPKLKSILFSRSPNSPVVDVSLAQCTTFSTSNAVHFNDAAARSDVRTTVLWQKVDQGRRPRRLRSTRRAGVALESRRALCWHRPPVLLPRGATRAKLCKCRQGRTPQNFDRVLAAACLYRDMLIHSMLLIEVEVEKSQGFKYSRRSTTAVLTRFKRCSC